MKAGAPATNAPPLNPAALADTVRNLMRSAGPGGMTQQRMLLLKTRLKLTPDQAAKIQTAMDADNKARRDLMRQWFQNGKVDPAVAASANTLDATLKSTLSGDQLAQYQKVQADENNEPRGYDGHGAGQQRRASAAVERHAERRSL